MRKEYSGSVRHFIECSGYNVNDFPEASEILDMQLGALEVEHNGKRYKFGRKSRGWDENSNPCDYVLWLEVEAQ